MDGYHCQTNSLAKIFHYHDCPLSEDMILGLGAGEGANLTDFGINWEKKVSKLDEAIQVIKLLFESSPKNKVSFEGEYYNLKKVFLQMPVKIS